MRGTFKREMGALDGVFALIDSFSEAGGLEEGIRYALNLCVEELFTNIVKYGAASNGEVEIELGVDGERLVVEIVEHGADRFDLTAVPPPDTGGGLDDRVPGGLGLHIVKTMMDTVTYEFDDGTARITLTRRLEK